MAFQAEELTTKVFPDSASLWLGCPQDTMTKGKPCQDHTKNPCEHNTAPPDGGGPCPQDTMAPTTHPPHEPRRAAAQSLPLLRAQLRERLALGATAL